MPAFLIDENLWIIITRDRDFAELFYFRERGAIGVILLRSIAQSPASFTSILQVMHEQQELTDISAARSLRVATMDTIRRFS